MRLFLHMSFVSSFWSRRETRLAVLLIVFMTALSTIHFFRLLWYHPADHRLIGVTHYYEDFFYYLDQFYQGASGRWHTVNRFSIEQFPPTYLYLNHIILGKIGGIFGWETYESYNIFNFLFKAAFFSVSYVTLLFLIPSSGKKRLAACIIFFVTSSLPQLYFTTAGIEFYEPVRVFRANITMLSRFGNVPNTHLINIYFLLGFVLLGKIISNLILAQEVKRTTYRLVLPTIIVCCLLAISEPMKLLLLAVLYGFILLLHRAQVYANRCVIRTGMLTLILFLLPMILIFFHTSALLHDPVYSQANAWDIKEYFNQHEILRPRHYLSAFGLPIFLMILAVIARRGKKKSVYEEMMMFAVTLSALGYILPLLFQLQIPGFRFLFSSVYLFAAVLILEGIVTICKRVRGISWWYGIAFYALVNLSALLYLIPPELIPLKEPDFHFSHMPEPLYQGFLYLRNTVPDGTIVLASADSAMDILIPGLTGKRTFSGHFLTTYKSQERDALSHRFYFGPMSQKEAAAFLRTNNIQYVLQTTYSRIPHSLSVNYPMLHIVYENEYARIFRVE